MPMIVFTCAPPSDSLALAELRRLDEGSRLIRRLAPGVGLLDCDQAWESFRHAVAASPPIWTRHLHPVQARAPLRNDAQDLATLEAVAQTVLLGLDTDLTFSVQTRLLGEGIQWQYSPFDINERLAALAASWGARLDVRAPDQVLSVTCAGPDACIGLSLASENLSSWAGGERRFKRDPGQISRAEFKLLEALEVFRIELPSEGRVLDMGAAPGGWTRMMAERGLHVVAVDPAELDPRAAMPGVRHLRTSVQEAHLNGPFALFLNDMRMDARDSARLMAEKAGLLAPGGLAVMTLKLPEDRMGSTAEAALRILRQQFELIGVRQLFHNRSELTAVMRREQKR